MKNYIKMEISMFEFEDDIIITSEDCTEQDIIIPPPDCNDEHH